MKQGEYVIHAEIGAAHNFCTTVSSKTLNWISSTEIHAKMRPLASLINGHACVYHYFTLFYTNCQ